MQIPHTMRITAGRKVAVTNRRFLMSARFSSARVNSRGGLQEFVFILVVGSGWFGNSVNYTLFRYKSQVNYTETSPESVFG